MNRTKVLLVLGAIGFIAITSFVVVVWHGIDVDLAPHMLVNDTDHPVTYRLLRLTVGNHVVIGQSKVVAPGKLAYVEEATCAFIEDGKGNVTSSILFDDVPSKLIFIPIQEKYLLSQHQIPCYFKKSDAICDDGSPDGSPAETCP